MNKEFKKLSAKIFVLSFAVILLVVLTIASHQTPLAESAGPAKEVPEVKKQGPMKLPETVLRSSLAGRWYPADAETLSKQIAGFFEKAQAKPIKNVIALILPHAGYAYSGQTAVSGLQTIDKEYKRIIIIGPSHRVPLEEILSVPRVTHYQTPLGQTPLDTEFIDKLLEHSVFQNVPQTHKYEHSVQIELPLLQYKQKSFKLVPIVVGGCSPRTINKAGAILKSLIDAETLVIASSDFAHFGPNYGFTPFKDNIPKQIEQLDMGAYEHIADLDSQAFLEYKRKTGATICGYIPVAILLSMLDKPTEAKLIRYTTSGEITGDYTNSVSYLAVAFSGAWGQHSEIKSQLNNPGLTREDKKQLLALARKSIDYFIQKRQVPEASELGITVSDAATEPRAAFVTLKKNSQLRGCIGDIFPRQPLYKSVINNAVNAAVNDWRFSPVTQAECNGLTIEISALTAPKPIASPDDIRIGTDGVVLNKNGRSAVFLPQVAPEQGWDVETMLRHLSSKAGLPADAWKEGANFLTFHAEVFSETEE